MKKWKEMPTKMKVWFIITMILVFSIVISSGYSIGYMVSNPRIFLVVGGIITLAIVVNSVLFLIFWFKYAKD